MKNYFFYFFLLISISVYSQNNKFSVDVSSGLSLPIGKYSGQVLNEGSFTKPGGNVLLNINWLAKPPFGVRISIGGSMHPVDVASLGWVKVASDPFLSDISIRSDPYLPLTAMGGVFYEKAIFQKVKFQGGVNAGMMNIQTPYQLNKPKYYLFGPEYFEITAAKDYTFVFQFALDFEYEIREGWSLIVHSSYNHANAEFTFWTANDIRVDRRPISYILANFGFRLKL